MRFSIIIPIYNNEKYLKDCFDSIEAQNYRDFEVVLVDDGSTDNSAIICDKYASEHPYVKAIHKKNGGCYMARQTGIAEAEGDYCISLDSDDLLEANALQLLADVIGDYSEQNSYDVIIYNAYEYDGQKKKVFFEHVFAEGPIKDKAEIYDKLLLTYSINALWLKAVKRSLFCDGIDIDENYRGNYGEDLLQSVPLLKKADKIYYLDKMLYNYRVLSGMMAKYNSNYYYSYRDVNSRVQEVLADQNIVDFEEKLAVHIAVVSYGGIIQCRYTENDVREDLDRIRQDKRFVESMKILKNSKYRAYLSKKEKLVLWLFRYRMYRMIKVLLTIKDRL